jgi:SAM-dependent methyltransferase
MPDLDENIAYWNKQFHWRYGGDEWSNWWGSPRAEWEATVFPRVAGYLPVFRIVEIAPGFGRWTEFLRDYADELIGVDVAKRCVKACRRRFRGDRRLRFAVNDGRTLPKVDARSADFVFSFDSLVHVEWDVMRSYVHEVARVLGDDGIAFLHHSNMAAYAAEEVGPKIPHWRSGSVSAEGVAVEAEPLGLNCFRQELLQWGDDNAFFSDAFTWITRAGSRHDREREVIVNDDFMQEAARALSSAGASV